MVKTLEMVFRNEAGKLVTLSLAEPLNTVTMSAVQAVMKDIIAKNIFASKGGALVQIADAKIRARDSIVLN